MSIFRGPLTGTIEVATAANMSTPTLIPLDDVFEEGIQMPQEEEGTQNNVRGESEQISTRLTFIVPVFNQALAALTTINGFIANRTRVWVRITDAAGNKVTMGGTAGCRVRRLANQNAVWGNAGAIAYTFETTSGVSGTGYTYTAAT